MSTVVEDFLDEDAEISGQRYVLLSFVSPEKVLENKDLFFFKKFLDAYEVDWKLKNLEKYMVDIVKNINDQLDDRMRELEKKEQFEQAEICRKNRVSIDNVMNQYNTFVQKNKADINKTKIAEAYDNFMYANKTKLEEEFFSNNEFRTSVRGIKVRGVYGNPKEAEMKAKKLQTKDKYNNIFIGDVGKWLPWDPQPHEVADQEYGQDQLNTLMRKYKENEDNRDKFFEERTKGAKGSKEKQVFSDTIGGRFNQGDLAMERKMEAKLNTADTADTVDTNTADTNTTVTP